MRIDILNILKHIMILGYSKYGNMAGFMMTFLYNSEILVTLKIFFLHFSATELVLSPSKLTIEHLPL